jgi:hypothetical protein
LLVLEKNKKEKEKMLRKLKIAAGVLGSAGLLALALPALATLTLDATSVDSSGALTVASTTATSVTIGNTANAGFVTLVGNLKIGSPAVTTITGTNPGTQIKLQYTATELASTNQLQGIQLKAVANLAGDTGASAAVTGIEIKAQQTAGNANIVGVLRAITGNPDAKDAPVGTMRAFEGVLDSQGSTISVEAVGMELFNKLFGGSVAASYGLSLNGGTVTGHTAYTRDIRLQNGAFIDNASAGTIALTAATTAVSGALTVGSTLAVTATSTLATTTVTSVLNKGTKTLGAGGTATVAITQGAICTVSYADVGTTTALSISATTTAATTLTIYGTTTHAVNYLCF